MELGPQNHNGDGLLGANSIIVVYMDALGYMHIYMYVCMYVSLRGFYKGFGLRLRIQAVL